jgi:hypothetical protein
MSMGGYNLLVIGKNPVTFGQIDAYESIHVQFENGIRLDLDIAVTSTDNPPEDVTGGDGYGQ